MHEGGGNRAGSVRPRIHPRSRLQCGLGTSQRAPASDPLGGSSAAGCGAGGGTLRASAGGHRGRLEGSGSAGGAEAGRAGRSDPHQCGGGAGSGGGGLQRRTGRGGGVQAGPRPGPCGAGRGVGARQRVLAGRRGRLGGGPGPVRADHRRPPVRGGSDRAHHPGGGAGRARRSPSFHGGVGRGVPGSHPRREGGGLRQADRRAADRLRGVPALSSGVPSPAGGGRRGGPHAGGSCLAAGGMPILPPRSVLDRLSTPQGTSGRPGLVCGGHWSRTGTARCPGT